MLVSCPRHSWIGTGGQRCPCCPPPRAGSTPAHRAGRALALARAGYRCEGRLPGGARCAVTVGLQAHHLIRRADGGSDTAGNYRVVCACCHLARTARDGV